LNPHLFGAGVRQGDPGDVLYARRRGLKAQFEGALKRSGGRGHEDPVL